METAQGFLYYSSPIGLIKISGTEEAITEILFKEEKKGQENHKNILLKECRNQLDAYFAGKLKKFDLPLLLKGTEFRAIVWKALLEIDYGETISYSELAKRINRPKAIRAVGGANHHNPISIIVPCHRVIGADGKLVGYGGGLWRKKWLLEHERRHK